MTSLLTRVAERAYRDCECCLPLSRDQPCGAGAATTVEAVPFALHQQVEHAEWDSGVVRRYEPGRVVVLFDDVGVRTLSLDVVAEHDLLTEID